MLEKTLGSYVHLIPSRTYDDALRHLGDDDAIALVICGVYFDQERMLDLLDWAKKNRPSLSFVCCRILEFETSSIFVEGLRIACESLGATFIDVPVLERQYGADRVESEFRSHVLSALAHGER